MARHSVKKVDSQGKTIKNFKIWRELNPNALFFDSKLEYNFDVELKRRGLRFEYHRTFLLQESFKFRDWCVRKVKDVGNVLGWHPVRIQGITWTPDFVLTDYNIVVEAKGRVQENFPNKLKMFKYMVLQEKLGLRVVVLHSLKELNEFLDYGLTIE